MTKEVQEQNPAGAEIKAPIRKRRGISNETRTVAKLSFHEKDAASNGLFIGHLEEITIGWSTKEDSKIFVGLKMPHLNIHFASNHVNVSEQRHVYQTLYPVESNVNSIPGGSEEWKVNNVMAWIKNMLDVFYLKGRALTAEEEDALSLSFIDYDEDTNEYIPVDPQEVLNAYTAIFTTAVDMLNGSYGLKEGEIAKPCFKSADGKILPLWIKLLRAKKVKTEWQNIVKSGDLAFNTFLGNGVIEIVRKDIPPTILRLDLAKESITPKEVKKVPSIGAPGMIGGGIVAGGAPVMPSENFNEAYNAASGDMPF